MNVDIDVLQTTEFSVNNEPFTVQIIDSVDDYVELAKEIFDFPTIKKLLQGNFRVLIDAMNGGRY